MFQHVTQVIVDCTTEKDGKTACPARIFWCISSIAYLILTGYQIKHSGQFDYVQFATGLGLVQAAGAAAVKIKETTEQTVG